MLSPRSKIEKAGPPAALPPNFLISNGYTSTAWLKAKDAFDFLGVHFRLCPVRKKNSKLKQSCLIWPSERSMGRIKQRVREVVGAAL